MHIFCYINEREENNSIHLSYSPKCSSLIKNVGSNSLVCLSSTPRAPPLSSSCSFLHQHSPPGSSPIWAGTAGEVVTDPSLHQGSQLAARICVECRSDHRTHELKTEVSSFFCEGSCSKYVQLCESVTTAQLCHRGVKRAIENMEMNGCGYVPIKMYLPKQAGSQPWLRAVAG